MREKHCNETLYAALPTHLQESISAKFARVSQSYSVHFQSEAHVHEFINLVRAQPIAWRDPRSGIIHAIKIRGDLPEAVRIKQRILGKLWQPVKDHIMSKSLWSAGCVLGSNGFRDESHFITNDDVLILFKASYDQMDNYIIQPNMDGLSEIQMSEPAAREIIRLAQVE